MHRRAQPTSPPSHSASRLDRMALGDARMSDIVTTLSALRHTKGLILVEGETGTGKTHLTHALHEDDLTRETAALITLDCSTVTPGAQTLSNALAALSDASGGTLVLSQVGGLARAHQASLFAASARTANTRVIATTTHPVSALQAAGKLALDAFDACGGQTVSLPPLRDRSDFAALVRQFVRELCTDRNIYVCPDAITLLQRHSWPGNLAELRTRLKLILALMGDSEHQLCPEDIPAELFDRDEPSCGGT